MKTILLVEDSRFLRLMNQRALVKAGYSVVTADDGEEAVRTALEKVPDLIILDMLLPKLSGPQVLRSLRNSELTTRVPVVVLSSLPQSNERRLMQDGATAYYDKSKLGLDRDADSLVQIVRGIFNGVPPKASAPVERAQGNLIPSAKGEA
jgi:CheY-like chemotaxis protein